MTDFYSAAQRGFQDQFGSRPLADVFEATIVHDRLDDDAKRFIESQEFFFLSTVDGQGRPTTSFKGGRAGFVSVVDETTLIFPSYDGNGMHLSVGNIAESALIGMLFIDFTTPNRLRVHATASVSSDDPLIDQYPGAQLMIRAVIDEVWTNCPRYIPKLEKVASSRYVPDETGDAPVPGWKQIDLLQPVLSVEDQNQVVSEGGVIDVEEYGRRLAAGDA